jgi:transcriptional regulator with XRE-family HTH domain
VEADEFKETRIALGLSRKELAEALDLHPESIRGYESRGTPISGPVALSLRLVRRLKEAGGATAKAVLDGLWRGA